MGGDGAHGAEGVAGGEGFLNEGEKSSGGMTGDHIEGDEIFSGTDEVLIVGIEDAEVVLAAVVGAVGDFLEIASGKPSVDFGGADGDDLEARLGGDDGDFAVCLMNHALQAVEAGDEEVLKVEAFQILDGRGFPEMKAAGVLRGGDEREFDARTEAKDAIAGDLEVTVGRLVVEQVMFLSASDHLGR